MGESIESSVNCVENKLFDTSMETVTNSFKNIDIVGNDDGMKKQSTVQRISLLKGKSFGKSFTPSKTLESLFGTPQKPPDIVAQATEKVEVTLKVVGNTSTDAIKTNSLLSKLKAKSFGKSFTSASSLESIFSPLKTASVKPLIGAKVKENSDLNIVEESTSVVETDAVVTYSRPQLCQIRDSCNADGWETYARESSWETTTDPFQFDPELRCSFPKQLRILRDREHLILKQKLAELNEKKKRDVVTVDLTAAKTYASGFVPSGIVDLDSVTSVVPLASWSSWDDFFISLSDFSKKTESERAKIVQGPMAFSRPLPEDVDEFLINVRQRLKTKSTIVLAAIRSAHPDASQQPSQPLLTSKDCETQTETTYLANTELPTCTNDEQIVDDDGYSCSTDTLDADLESDGREHIFESYADLLASKIKLC